MASATPDLQLWLPSRHRKTVTYLLTYLQSEWWGAGMVICLERGADLHMAQLMLLPLTVSCFSKIQIGFTFLVPAHLDSPRQRAVKRMYVTIWVSQYQKRKTSLDLNEARDDEVFGWQWHQLDHM